MKIIDILNKIANREEVRFKILNDDEIYHCYRYDTLFNETAREEVKWYIDEEWLNSEVEIIEEERKIPEKLNGILEFSPDGNHISKVPNNEQLMFKIDEIIDYLQSKGDE